MNSKVKYPESGKQAKMPTGYNEIHVFIEESSALCLNKNEDIEAMISVQAFGKIQYSKVLSKVGYESKLWAEHLYFSKTFKKEEAEALEKSLIIIKAWDHKKILSSALIGEHELSVSKIYASENHLLGHTWLALSNVTKNHGEVSGMVKVSINVTNEDDVAQTLELEPYNAVQKGKSIQLASNMSRKGHQLTFDIFQGSHLKPVAGQTADAYIGLQFGMIYEKTQTVVNDLNPQWNETLKIPVHLPAHVDNVILRLIDANVFKSKEVMGSCYVPINQLVAERYSRGFFASEKRKSSRRYDEKLWVNFYGPQVEGQNNQYKHMYSIYPDLAPYYTGSVLLKAVLEPNSAPLKERLDIQAQKDQQHSQDGEDGDGEKKVKLNTKPFVSYRVRVKFQLGMNLPNKFYSFSMAARVGTFELESPMKKVRHGFATWNSHKEMVVQFYQNQDIPDIFFYLINQDQQKICYYRYRVGDRKTVRIENTWRQLKPDLTKLQIYHQEAGYVKFELELTPLAKGEKLVTQVAKSGPSQPDKSQIEASFSDGGSFYSQIAMNVPCKIIVDLFCAQNLLAGDDDGSADPYFRFTFQESVTASSVKECTVNPTYLERLILQGSMGESGEIMPLTVTVFNKNPITDQPIGTCYINLFEENRLKRIALNTNYNHNAYWHEIQIDGSSYGRFLAGITIVKSRLPLCKGIVFFQNELQTYEINLFVLGLRCLKSSNSIISIRKPIVYFDFDSLFAYSSKEREVRQEIKRAEQNEAQRALRLTERAAMREHEAPGTKDGPAVRKKQPGKKAEKGKPEKEKQEEVPSHNLKFEPVAPGSSVNIQQQRTIEIKLPKNQQLWPTLCAKVTNSVIGDLYEPHVGYFYINLNEAYARTKKLREEYNHQSSHIGDFSKPLQVKEKLKHVSPALLNNLIIFVVKNVKYNWHEACKDTEKKLIRMRREDNSRDRGTQNKLEPEPIKRLDENFIVVIPSYVFDDTKNAYVEQFKETFDRNREYVKVGYDNKGSLKKNKQQRNRHYRYCLDRPYEKYYEQVNGVKFGVFSEVPIRKGRKFLPEEKNLLTGSLLGSEETQVGFYKGNCLVLEKGEVEQTGNSLFKQAKRTQLQSYLKTQSKNIRMYLYVLNAFSIPKKSGALPEPYLVVRLSDKLTRNFSQDNAGKSTDPQFNVLVRQDLSFPENSEIILQVWNRGVTSDELIGQAVIYAQNRVFYQFGRMKFNNPIQTHPLKVMQSRQEQGKVRFWVDFVPINLLPLYKEFDIKTTACTDFEVRVIVWGCSDIRSDQHDFTDMVDLFVTCEFNGEVKDTDVHYRVESGDGSFNWRMIYPLKLPVLNSTLTFKVYDKSLMGKNSYLAIGDKNIGGYIQEAYENEIQVKVFEGEVDMKAEAGLPCEMRKDKSGYYHKYDIFNINLYNKGEGNVGEVEAAKLLLSVEVLPRLEAEKRRCGEGRGDPNEYPNLPEPTGRLQFSMNPVTMLTRLCGKRFKNKICMIVLCFLLSTCMVYFLPSIFGSLLAKTIAG